MISHVYGHSDFFKNNVFGKSRKMVDTISNHAVRINRYIDEHGKDVVEQSSTSVYPWKISSISTLLLSQKENVTEEQRAKERQEV